MNNPRSQILLKLQNFVVVFFILCYSATSQIAQYKFHRLNENQGLANGFINQIKQDTLGFMWIASNDGLYRFDGSQFKSYRTTTINAIPNNTTNDLLVDSRNNVYVATDNGLAVYSNELDSIIHYLPNEVFGSNAENVITSLTSSDRAIYLGTSGSGVYKFESGILSKVSFGKDTTYTNFRDISDLKFRGNTLWAASWTRGLLRHNIVNGKTDIVTSMDVAGNSSNISELFIDSFDRVWLGTNRGVFTAVNNTDGISLEPFDNLTASEVDALSIYEDREGIIWVGTRNDGLFKIGNDEVVHFVPKRDGSSVSHRTISSIEQDSNGNLWLGTHNNGIDVFDPAGEIVSNINPVKYDQTNDYLSESVWGIHESDNGIWLGTDGSGLYHYNQTTAEVERIASSKSKLRLTDDAVLSIEVAYDQKIWVGTYNGGINILDTRMDAVQYFNMANSSLSTNDIRVLFEDQQKTMWIGTNRGGLYSYNDADQLNPIAGTQSLDIRGIIEDQDQMLWLATYGDGLVKYNPKNNKLEYFDWTSDLPNQQPIALSINLIDHYVLVATMQSGLVRFDTEDQSFDRFDEINGIINNTVRAIHPEQSTIWMSTNTGLSVLDLSDGEIRNFDSFDGLQKGHYNDGSFVRDANGRFFFGGIHGLDFFNPQELLTNQYFPKVTFTSLKIDNEIIRPNASTSIEASMPIVNEITLLPDQDVITIGFNVIAFPNALGWSFEYLLDGFDETWTTGTKNNDATYRNIPPGNYTFTVRAVDHVGGRTGQVSTIGIKVLPPWWRTIYAYIGFVAVLIFLAWVIYRNVKERISMRQKLFYEQKLRHQEFETMQDKIRFYTNFSHEMKTPISLISGPVNDLLRSTEIPERSKKSLRLIKRNSQSLLKLVNRLLEFRKIETKNTALNVGYHDLTILAQEEAESFSYLAKDRDVKFGFYCETDLKAWIDIEKFQIIINNLLLNALKYSEPSTKVTFKVLHEAPSIVAIISDEGRGIAKEELQHIFTPFYQARNSIGTGGTGIGLALCKSFVELHGGTIEVESSLGQGSTFKLTIPEDKEHFEGQDHIRFIEVNQGEIDESATLDEPTENEITENEQVLLIADDNRDIRLYVASLFEKNFKVVQASDGKKALEVAKETVPDIIISDIMMPVVDGLEFCKNIKDNAATSHVPVILLTAKGTSQTKIEGYEVGADGYITKPFDSEVLTARVQNLLESREKLKDIHLARPLVEKSGASSKEIEFLLKVEAAVIEMIPNGDLNVIELCRELGFSRTSLYRKIKSLTGQSIKQFIRSIKLKRAAEMLATEDMSVSEIAFSLDFTDLKYFRNCFKKQYDKLPSEYQNEMKSQEPIDQEAIKKAVKI